MKKTSFILVALAMVAMLFGCSGAEQILSGSTFSTTDSYTEEDLSITSNLSFAFNKDGTGTMTSTSTETDGSDSFNITYTMNFSWTTDDSTVTISGSSFSYAETDGTDTYTYTKTEDITLVGTLEKKTLSFSYDYNGENETNFYICCFDCAAYYKWDSECSAYDDYSSCPVFTISLTK